MVKDFELSLYDLFGYLMPGCVATAGIYLAVWGLLLHPNHAFDALTAGAWTVLVAVAYIAGHGVQALSNAIPLLEPRNLNEAILADTDQVPSTVLELSRSRAAKRLELAEAASLGNAELFEFVDHCLVQRGQTGTREIYTYREGFYRGLGVSAIFLAIGAILRMSGQNGTISAFGANVLVTNAKCLVLAAASLLLAGASILRMRRFSLYRVKNSLYGFLALEVPD